MCIALISLFSARKNASQLISAPLPCGSLILWQPALPLYVALSEGILSLLPHRNETMWHFSTFFPSLHHGPWKGEYSLAVSWLFLVYWIFQRMCHHYVIVMYFSVVRLYFIKCHWNTGNIYWKKLAYQGILHLQREHCHLVKCRRWNLSEYKNMWSWNI